MRQIMELVGTVARSYPGIFLNPVVDVLYLVVLGLVAMQYARVQSLEERMYGKPLNRAFGHILESMGLGLFGGFLASILLVVVGVTVSDSGIGYLLPTALFLFLISPRFLCYSYAGGLVSLSYLLFGWPEVNVAAIAGLVACLHAAESFLIWANGARCATPLYLQGKDGATLGAFSLQQFWPIPLIVLFLTRVPSISDLQGVLSLPDWWPLLVAPRTAGIGVPVFQMMPIVAALGYGDLALARSPRDKSKATSRLLALFSFILLGFAIAASRMPAFAWVAAIFGPVGHEVVIRMGNRDEAERDPIYVAGDKGVLVMGTLDRSLAREVGLDRGDVILEVQGAPVRSKADVEDLLRQPGEVRLLVKSPGMGSGTGAARETVVKRQAQEPLGLILAPGLGDLPLVSAQSEGPLLSLLKRALRRT